MQFKMHARHTATDTLESFAAELALGYSEIYTDFATMMAFFLAVPMNSVPCERGFSTQNLTKVKACNRLGEEKLEQIMRITINVPHFATFDYHDAAANFRAMRERRLV